MKAKLDHIAIVVESIDEAKIWFGKYFGFINEILTAPIKATGGPGIRCLVSNDIGTVLELCEYESKRNMDAGNIQHLGFSIDSAREYYDVLQEDGILTDDIHIQDMGPVNILFFKGIYGIEFELIERKRN
ncbi:VOC family protein [Crassaminicella profunda]|uniref:VOC family protein n=1 Tax=Crassaminicella profunda TaxID=1286698 RepID=UPI001CA6ABE4|nr:VOC family protein [Crassaminicella profunda]QZY56056.1 VOC family protein [Crassaminicella profunda]